MRYCNFTMRMHSALMKLHPSEVGCIHGDFNEQNIIVDAQDNIHGVIDFGDSQKNPLVYDIAIAIMYMMTKVRFIYPS